jgi:hypothetical protein
MFSENLAQKNRLPMKRNSLRRRIVTFITTGLGIDTFRLSLGSPDPKSRKFAGAVTIIRQRISIASSRQRECDRREI